MEDKIHYSHKFENSRLLDIWFEALQSPSEGWQFLNADCVLLSTNRIFPPSSEHLVHAKCL